VPLRVNVLRSIEGRVALRTTGRDELPHRPGLSIVERHGSEQAVAGELFSVRGWKEQTLAFLPVSALVV